MFPALMHMQAPPSDTVVYAEMSVWDPCSCVLVAVEFSPTRYTVSMHGHQSGVQKLPHMAPTQSFLCSGMGWCFFRRPCLSLQPSHHSRGQGYIADATVNLLDSWDVALFLNGSMTSTSCANHVGQSHRMMAWPITFTHTNWPM